MRTARSPRSRTTWVSRALDRSRGAALADFDLDGRLGSWSSPTGARRWSFTAMSTESAGHWIAISLAQDWSPTAMRLGRSFEGATQGWRDATVGATCDRRLVTCRRAVVAAPLWALVAATTRAEVTVDVARRLTFAQQYLLVSARASRDCTKP